MLKKIVVVSIVAIITALTMACGNGAEDACDTINEKCASQQGFTKQDCSKASDDYDKLSDADKEKADKYIDCVDDASDCAAIIACAASAAK
jgi:hypothetical protein